MWKKNKKNEEKKPYAEFEKYLKENPEPMGVEKNGLKEYSMEEVAKHNAPPSICLWYNNIWIIILEGV